MLASQIEATLEIFRPYLSAAASHLSRISDTSLLAEYNVRLHQVVRASIPIMADAESMIRRTAPNHIECVASYLKNHCIEEHGHDLWIEHDLVEIKSDKSLDLLPSISAARLVGEAYYIIRHHSPLAILGYIAAIECNPPGKAFVDRLARISDGRGVGAIAEHSVVDVQHSQELIDLFNIIAVSEKEEETILYCARRTMVNSIEFVNDIIRLAPTSKLLP